MTILCLRRSGPSTGIRPSVIAAASSPVKITIKDRWADPHGDLGDQLAVVGLGQHRLDRGHGVDEGRQDLRGRGAQHAGPDVPVGDQQVDPVTGPGGQGGQQQRRVHRVVELGLVADPAGRGAARVQHDQHVPVPLRPPGADHHGGRPGRAPPVDGAHVVARDVLPQAVELGALPALQDGGPAVQLPQPGQPAGQVLAGVERRQRADGPRCAVLGLPSGHPQRPSARITTGPARRSPRRVGPQGQFVRAALPGRDRSPAAPRRGRRPTASRRRARWPADPGGRGWSAPAGCGPPRPAGPTCRRPAGPGPWPARRRAAMSSADHQHQHQPVAISTAHQVPAIATASTAARGRAAPARQVRDQSSLLAGSPRHRHGGQDRLDHRVGGDALSSASGRRLTRCRSVGKASALTSSGET